MIVTVSGYNASGKSTLARELVRRLRELGIDSRHARFDALYPSSFLRKKRRRIDVPKSATSVNLRALQGMHASWNRTMRWYHCANMFCAALHLCAARWLRPNSVVVFDRYFYDRLIHFRASGPWYTLMTRFAPHPDVGFVLLPELPVWEGRMLARLHKKSEVEGVRIADGDLDSLAMVWERFERFAASARSIHVIDSGTTSGIDSAWALIEEKLPSALVPSSGWGDE